MHSVKPADETQHEPIPAWLWPVALLVLLYAMYSSTFLTDYLMKDELNNIGPQAGTPLSAMRDLYLFAGRPFFGLFLKLVYNFAGYSTARIQFVRFINFAALALVAAALLSFLQRGRMQSKLLAFLTVLFCFSQLPYQGVVAYGVQLIGSVVPSIWLSLLAFYLFFFVFPRGRLAYALQIVIAGAILLLAMLTTQTYAFFSAIPAAYLALSDWTNRKDRLIGFLATAFGVLVLSTLAYKVMVNLLHQSGGQSYKLAEQGLSTLAGSPAQVLLTALNPLTYWSVFKLWTFPYPFTGIAPIPTSAQERMAAVVMVLWLAVILCAVWIEVRRAVRAEKRKVLFKWIAALFSFGLAAVFVVADSPTTITDHRPHIYLVFSGLVCFTGAYALERLSSEFAFLRHRAFVVLAAIIVLMIAFGAQSGVQRNVVDAHMRQVDFIRLQLASRPPESYDQVIVVLPSPSESGDGKCVTEPCGLWMGVAVENRAHLNRPAAYNYALATLGMDPQSKTIRFVDQLPAVIPPRSAVVNWPLFTASVFSGPE